MSDLTDIGVNLLHSQFSADREQVIQRARAAGVARMLITATNLTEAEAAATFCTGRSGLWCTAGVHPHDAKDVHAVPNWQAELAALAQRSAVRAVGETGLDFFRNFSPPDVQLEVFRAHLAIAAERQLPVFVHDRDSQGHVAATLAEFAPHLPDVVVHCFTGSHEDLVGYLEAGYYIGITGWVCDQRRGEALRGLVPLIPLDRLLIETDAPFLRPHNAPPADNSQHRKRNEPALLPFVVRQLAELYSCDPEHLASQTHGNAERLFDLAD